MAMRATPISRSAKGRGGRPTRAQAVELEARLLEAATGQFLGKGFGATSMEDIARAAGISKRTLYARYAGKETLFAAVVHRLVDRLRPPDDAQYFEGGTLEEILTRLARFILRAALSPRALALQRIMLSEAARFPELATVLEKEGARREAVTRIGGLLTREAENGAVTLSDADFAAEQFLQMVVTIPQRRAMGVGAKMTPHELEEWGEKTVALFLDGLRRR